MRRRSRSWSPVVAGALLVATRLVLTIPSAEGATLPEHSVAQQLPPALSPADAATRDRVRDWSKGASSGWTPNLGQVADSGGRVAHDVLFETSIPGARVFVTRTGLTHLFITPHESDGAVGEDAPGWKPLPDTEADVFDWARLDLALVGGAIEPERVVVGQRFEGQGTQNFYLAHCPEGVLEVPTYGEITFPGVYPGVDWVVRSEPGGGVHHDFVVAPGGDPGRIRLRYTGATALSVSEDGRSLIATTALGEVREGALLCYQGDAAHPVAARFELTGDEVRVRLGAYDRSRPLVIDPPLVWSTYYGGTNYDGPVSIYCDDANSTVYVVGYTASADLPALNPGGGGYYQGTYGGAQDAFIWKFTQLGVRLWATYYGGSGGEGGTTCTVDGAGNLYAGGYTSSTDFPLQVLAGAYNQPTVGGPLDGFLVRFNSAGVRQWATYFGGSQSDQLDGMSTDLTGRLFICGTTSSADFPVQNPGGGAFVQATPASTVDAYVSRFGGNGALQWSTYLGGALDDDYAVGLATNASSVYVTGTTFSSTFPTFDPGGGAYYQANLSGGQDAFLSRFTLAGVLQWSTYFGGSLNDSGDEPAVTASGHVYLYGFTGSTDLPTYNPGGGAYFQPANAGGDDLFLARFTASNNPVWSTYIGGSLQETVGGRSIAVDAAGRVSITAMTGSTDYPVLNPGNGAYFNNTFGGLRDALITQFAPNSAMSWSTYWGTTSTDFGTGVAVNAQGCLFATGESVELGTMTTVNPGFGAWFQTANAGSDDGYLAKFCAPSSACCLDFTCVPVSSAAECNNIGGTAFFPGQPCSTTVCTILCTICGRKFHDLNRDGVQQGGEPGLAGWTIQLSYPNNLPYATAVTDAQGDYCFNNVPCGPWLVSEVHHPGWVQTYPPNAAHALNTTTGSTTNGIDFGNYACAGAPPCATPPTSLAAWWPFDEDPATGAALDVAHAAPPRNVAQLTTAGSAPGALCLTSPGDHALVPAIGQQDLAFGEGSFSVAAWLSMLPAGAGERMIADTRVLDSSSGALGVRGWALWLDGPHSYLALGTGDTPQVVPGPMVAVGTWTHLVVSVDRVGGQGRWYLNGTHEPLFDFTPIAGDVSTTADLRMGQPNPAFGTGVTFDGCIGDLSLFRAPLTEADARKAWEPWPAVYCPEYALMPAVTTLCPTQTQAQICFKIVNNTPNPQSYHWSLAPLPAGPGCTVAGPTVMTPSAGTVTVPAGSPSAVICVTVQRPPGLTAQNATACLALTFVNDATGVCRTRTATLRADNTCWCATPSQASVVGIAARVATGGTIGVGVELPCDPIARAYQWRAVWLDADHPDPLAVSLNGLPPGEPVLGTLTAPEGGVEALTVQVSYPGGYDPTAQYEIVLEADSDGDGLIEVLRGVVVHPVNDDGISATEPTLPGIDPPLVLSTSPNPFLGRARLAFYLAEPARADLRVYDLSGRLVRRVHQSRLEAGDHAFDWDGRNDFGRETPAGIYFVRLEAGAHRVVGKIVKAE